MPRWSFGWPLSSSLSHPKCDSMWVCAWCVSMLMHMFLCVCRNTHRGKCTKAKGQSQVLIFIFHLAWDRVSLFFICEYRTSWLEIRGLSYLSLPLATRAQELQPCASKPGFVWVPDPSACAANTAPLSLLTASSSIRVNGSKEFNLFINTVGCGSACF